MTFFRGEIFSNFLLHLTATSSNDETIRVTTNMGSRLGDLVVVMELPWKRHGESSGSFFESYGARETKVEADKTMPFEDERGEDRQSRDGRVVEEYIDQLWLFDRKFEPQSCSPLDPLFHPLSSLFSSHCMCTVAFRHPIVHPIPRRFRVR